MNAVLLTLRDSSQCIKVLIKSIGRSGRTGGLLAGRTAREKCSLVRERSCYFFVLAVGAAGNTKTNFSSPALIQLPKSLLNGPFHLSWKCKSGGKAEVSARGSVVCRFRTPFVSSAHDGAEMFVKRYFLENAVVENDDG